MDPGKLGEMQMMSIDQLKILYNFQREFIDTDLSF